MDESQLEVDKSLVEWKLFKTEDEAKTFRESQVDKIWSDIGHSEKGYYVGYCIAGELAAKSVVEAGRYYKLNVDLAADYMLGIDWSTCH